MANQVELQQAQDALVAAQKAVEVVNQSQASTEAAQQAVQAANGLSPLQKELLSRADAIFDSIGKGVQATVEAGVEAGKVVAEQIPDIAMQYVAYGRAIETFYMLLAFAMLSIGFWLVFRVGFADSRKYGNTYGSWAGERILAGFTGGITCLIGFIVMMTNVKDFVFVWFAPKMWLILEMVNLARMVVR